jgi:hypothetical protein
MQLMATEWVAGWCSDLFKEALARLKWERGVDDFTKDTRKRGTHS